MQFKVPQNVQREDRIVGPLTLKQLIICGVGAITAYAIYVSLAKTYIWITWGPPIAIVTIITIAFAFIRPLDLSFGKWILRWAEFSLLPKKRHWIKASGEIEPTIINTKTKDNKKNNTKDELDPITQGLQKMDKLKKFLESEKNKA